MTLDENLCKEIENSKTKYLPLIYFKSKTQTLANDLNIYNSLNFFYQTIFSKIQKWRGEGSCWTIKLIYGEYININIYNSLVGSYKE